MSDTTLLRRGTDRPPAGVLSHESLKHALAEVVEPDLATNVVSLGMIEVVTVCHDKRFIGVEIALPCFACPIVDLIVDQVELSLNRFKYESRVFLSRRRLAQPGDMSPTARLRLFRNGILAHPGLPASGESADTPREFEIRWCDGKCDPDGHVEPAV